MPRLIVHIGAKKTGTTTLQRYLKLNQSFLASRGIFVSKMSGVTEDTSVARAYMSGDRENARAWFSEAAEFCRRENSTAILTAESLTDLDLNEIGLLREDIPGVFDSVSVILYVRRQDLAATSHYSTNLRGGGISKALMSTGMGRRGKRSMNYGSIVRDYSVHFALRNMLVRGYVESGREKWNVIEDFAQACQLDIMGGPVRTTNSNERLSSHEMAYLRKFNDILKSENIVPSAELRKRFISLVPKDNSIVEKLRPSKAQAENFYDSFSDDNKILFLLAPEAHSFFSGDFSMYPDQRTDPDTLVDMKEFERIYKSVLAGC